MLEKLKDFFYDFSDTLLSLTIILLMALVITWKLSGAMSIAIFDDKSDVQAVVKAEDPKVAEKDVVNVDNNIPQENTNQESNNEENKTPENITEPPTKPDNNVEVVNVESKDIKVEIPKGSTGSSIAAILLEKGLISSKKEFLDRVEEKGLAPKLRYGDFTVKSGSSIDKIISIITGVS
ncbi:hypothetical protein R9X47_05600 [Wukongibacter baidiensis]|uniref:hypothetical protein n=1 Tax=Wukongibacter baidiensis TaxID=1723361 RepID=UPI003D7F52F1